MSFTITKNPKSITNAGGGICRIWEVNENGQPVLPMVVTDIGYCADSNFNAVIETEEVKDETLKTVAVLEGEQTVSLTGTLLQSGLEMLELISETRGKYFGCYKKFGDTNGKYNEIVFGRGVVTPKISIKNPKPRPEFEIKFAIIESAVTYDSTAMSQIGAKASSALIPAGEYYIKKQTAIA